MLKTKKNIAVVALPLPLLDAYDYKVPDGMSVTVGDIVSVPFRRESVLGVVVDIADKSEVPEARLKSLSGKVAEGVFSPAMLRFLRKVADYNVAPFGAVLKMAMSVPDAFKKVRVTKASRVFDFALPKLSGQGRVALTPSQEKAAAALAAKVGGGYSATLLKGLTGSGKTEVYFEPLEKALAGGGQVLVLLPEIMLTTQWLERFKRRFGVEPALWHSDLTPAVRRQTWQAVNDGRAKVLVGARSGLFLPFKNLALIVVDEEHDASFKQEDGVVYQARDMAVLRASIEKVPIILSSATPSLETLANVRAGRYGEVVLSERAFGAKMPALALIDMRAEEMEKLEGGRPSWISPSLAHEITKTLKRGEQVLLFLNRRGYAPLMLCRACGHRITCPNCSAWMVEHRQSGRMLCHHCNASMPIPSVCPACKAEESLVSCGPGAERVFEEVRLRFPSARAVMVTSDTLGSAKKAAEVLDRICAHEVDIIVGTQVLTKGHHFPLLTLIGVIDADLGLAGGDMRAGERTFQLMNQVAGRAGREGKEGAAFLQTYLPDNGVLKALVSGSEEAFMAAECEMREMLMYPPFGKMAALIISGGNEAAALKAARGLAKCAPPPSFEVEVLGPAPAPIALLKGKYRFRLLVKAPKKVALSAIIKEWLTKIKISSSIKVEVDVDPYNFM